MSERKTVRLRAFNGMINKADEVLVLVQFSAEHEEGSMWLPISKSTAKSISAHCEENGIEEVENVMEEDGNLYLDVPEDDEEGEVEGEDEPEEPTEEEEPEEET